MKALLNGFMVSTVFWALAVLVYMTWDAAGEVILIISIVTFLVFLGFALDTGENTDEESKEDSK